MNFFQRLWEKLTGPKDPNTHKGSKNKTAIVAGGLAGAAMLITVSATQVLTPTGEPPPFEGYPTIESVGPDVAPTVAYTGDCNFGESDDGLIIDNRIVNCAEEGVRFSAGDYTVTFRDSVINGQLFTFQYTPGDTDADTYPREPVFIVEDSEVYQTSSANGQDRAVCCSHYIIRRSYLQGGHSVAAIHNNGVIEDSYLTTDGTSTHSSGMRVLKNAVIDGNTVICKPAYVGTDGGCSAAAVFYSEALDGSDSAAFNLNINGNYFKRGTIGGVESGPYNATRFIDCENRNDCINLIFTNNQVDLGWGIDADEFPTAYGGNVFSGNTWVDGQSAETGEVR
jgi:hypothetical protein